jgi:hypothetical protein
MCTRGTAESPAPAPEDRSADTVISAGSSRTSCVKLIAKCKNSAGCSSVAIILPVRIVMSRPSRIPVNLNAYKNERDQAEDEKVGRFRRRPASESTNSPIARYTSAISRSTCQSVRSVGSRYTTTGTATVALPRWSSAAANTSPSTTRPWRRSAAEGKPAAASERLPPRSECPPCAPRLDTPAYPGAPRRRASPPVVSVQRAPSVAGSVIALLHQVRNRQPQGSQRKYR